MKIFEAVNWGTEYLEKLNIENASYDARALMLFILDLDMNGYFMAKQDICEKEALDSYKMLIEKRGTHYPLQYILGKAGFMGFDFYVSEGVLIPRQDTEILCENALEIIKHCSADSDSVKLLDMCTGSGCIGISLDKLSSEKGIKLDATLADISDAALSVSKKNIQSLKSEAKLIKSDLFSEITDKDFDIIVSNPPYIDGEEMKSLMPEVRDFEPHLALYGKEDGLFFYREITEKAKTRLKNAGYLIYEIGCSQAKAVSGIMASNGFCDIVVKKDYAGLDRVVMGRLDGL